MADPPKSTKPPDPIAPKAASEGGMLVTTPIGPKDHMRPSSSAILTELTESEQKAGQEAVKNAQDRKRQEQEAGQKLAQRLGAPPPPQNPVAVPQQPLPPPRSNPLHGG